MLERFNTLWPLVASTAQEKQVIEKILHVVKPVKRSLGVFRTKQRTGKRSYTWVEQEHFVIDFPIQDVIEVVLQVPGLIPAVDEFRAKNRDTASAAGEIRTFYDGIAWKHLRPLPHEHPDAYALCTYGDGVTFTDPCSAYTAHKLQMNYWALMELPLALQGLSSLVLVSHICWSSTLKVAGLRRVFGGRVKGEQDVSAPGVQIKELYHGVLMKTSRASAEVVRAYVHVHCADTPEANISCGKMETCSKTLCFCRHCYAKQSQRLMPADTVGFLSAVAGLGTCAYTLRCAHIDAAEHAAVQIGADGSQYGISNSLK